MPVPDYGDVGCERYREALSARLDGEAEPVAAAEVDTHLAGCPDCRRWFDDAAAVTRLARTGPAAAGVDVTDAVLPAAPGRWRGRLAVALRVALGALGTAQLVLGLLQLTALRPGQETHVHGSTVDGATPGHLWHESAAWNVAVGAAFLWVAARRGRPVGIVPILTVFLAVLTLLSAADVMAGRVEATRLATHGFVLTGYLIVLALCRAPLDLFPSGGRARDRAGPDWAGAGPRDAPDEQAASGYGADEDDPAGRVIRFPGPGQGPGHGQPAAGVRMPEQRREAA